MVKTSAGLCWTQKSLVQILGKYGSWRFDYCIQWCYDPGYSGVKPCTHTAEIYIVMCLGCDLQKLGTQLTWKYSRVVWVPEFSVKIYIHTHFGESSPQLIKVLTTFSPHTATDTKLFHWMRAQPSLILV